jgi:tripartite-type tricarboxylate transporter receptor subunit TctC
VTPPFVRRVTFPCIACLVLAGAAHAQTIRTGSAPAWPVKSIRLLVGYTPGGGTDIMSRVLAKYLGESVKQTVIVDNRPGAGGVLATELVAKAPPDGYTLLTTPSTHAINPGLYAKLPYDSIADFTAVGLIATSPNVFVVHPLLPVRSVRELIALARSRPGELTFASAGVGSTTHLAGEYFRSLAKIKTVHVPYKGSSQAEIDLATGQVHYMIDSAPAALPNIKAGRTRALATTGAKRFSALPDVPTAAESGLREYESISWWGIIGPAGMPQAVVDSSIRRSRAS